MFSTWDLVRPRYWHPLASMEQSMMDLDFVTNQMMLSPFPFSSTNFLLAVPDTSEDDDFFKDLPMHARGQSVKPSQPKSDQEGQRAFSTYSFTDSSMVDDKGQRIVSTRRRYEDSTGRLKAVHERRIGDQHVKTVWNRKSKDDQGQHKTISHGTNAEEFEKKWRETPFFEAQQQQEKQLKEKGEQQHPSSYAAAAAGKTSKKEHKTHQVSQQQQQHHQQQPQMEMEHQTAA